MSKRFNVLVIIAALWFGCTIGTDVAGTSEQGNARIVATVYTSEGAPASGATVRVRREDYTKNAVLDKGAAAGYLNLITDQDGKFVIDSLDTGSFLIEVTDRREEALLIRYTNTEESRGEVILDPDTLHPFASISGKVDYNVTYDRRFVQVVGLERLTEVDVDGFFTFSDLPAGSYTVKVVSIDPEGSPIVYEDIVALSGQTTQIAYEGWLYSRAVYLNTTSTGAAVFDNVYNFPVLLRLNSDNFRFSEARTHGEDLRFIKPDADSTLVPFEIERWDSTNALAEIWVKADTVYANSTTLSFIMEWGNPNAGSAMQSGAVFDTLNGFGGVWHLSEQGSAQATDATHHGFDGTVVNVESTEGIIGRAGRFSNNRGYITIENTASSKLNFPVEGSYSVSAWVNSDSISENRHILSKGDVQYYLKIHNFNWHFAEYRDDPASGWAGWDHTSSPYDFGRWVHLYGVRDGASQYLYVNGECVDSTIAVMGGTEPRDESFDVEIGRRLLPDGSAGQYFRGLIDEVRICTGARNESWIKLSYMNQRPDNLLVQFGR